MYATQQLRDEHEGIKTVLSVLETLADEMQQGRQVNLDHLEQIIDFLRTFADRCHHGKEEALLFPALRDAGIPVEGGPIGAMLHDHDEGRGYIRGMVDALQRLHAGEDARKEFAQNALSYVSLLRAHIQKENMVLFPMAEQRLSEGDHERLAHDFDKVEEEQIGPGVHERFHEMIHTLSEKYLKKAA
ncbi:MAG TPA: hemerythrin domain-containing protein [Armatimonadota bacterium]